jgi:hypothetical protein
MQLPMYAQASTRYGFVQLGQLQLKNPQSQIEAAGETLYGEYSDLPFFTAGIQNILGGETFRFGYEAGALLSWQNDSVTYAAAGNGGSTVALQIDNDMFLFGTFIGLMADINIANRARIFLSSGPILSFAMIDQRNEQDASIIINGNTKDVSAGAGWYAASGVVISITKTTELGIVLREQRLNIDFSNDIENRDYDGRQVMLSLGFKL